MFGQQDQGSITGIVQDSTGALVPGAEITLTNVDTGFVVHTLTDKSGVYTFSPVKIGNYSVTGSAPGFTKTVRENLHLDVQQRLAVNITLKPGAIEETMTVTAAPPLLQTEEASVGQVYDTKALTEAPLNGRNYIYLAQLTNGIVDTNSTGFRGAAKGDFSSNGGKAEHNNFILDGVDNNVNVVDFLNGATYAVRPPPEAISEFKAQTSSYSAEFGHSSAARRHQSGHESGPRKFVGTPRPLRMRVT